jgi:orotidine-5'-phosphate decarboxylase
MGNATSAIVFKEREPGGDSPVILALDTSDLDLALDWAELTAPAVGMVKVGLELFCAHGAGAVRALRDEGHRVMLDLKLHDIPATVARAVEAAAELEADLVTVHAMGGPAMLEAAVEAAAGRVKVTAVTLLTSLSPADLAEVGMGAAEAVAERLARLAVEAGCPALVCSPLEVGRVRAAAGPGVGLVCPGVRPAAGARDDQARAARDDQARVATPAETVRAGADWLVVGRPITRAPDPARAARAVRDEAVAAR